MSSSQLLNHQFHQTKQSINSPTLVFIHGLFGDMNNLGVIARAFSDNYNILRVDLRNHGHSFHSETMNYDVMADDVWQLIDHLQLDKVPDASLTTTERKQWKAEAKILKAW
ncbi:MAG: alpha/beta fold hydrolase, partial [Haemophilus parainfluenzae]